MTPLAITLVVVCILGVIVSATSQNYAATAWATLALIGAIGRLV